MRKNDTLFLSSLVILSFFITITAPLKAENDLKFSHLTVIDGLLHNSATCLAQDSAGYIWIGTQRGLNRFDGYKVDSYLNEADLYSTVFNNRIRKMVVLDDNIWVATYKGLQCFDLKTKKYINYVEENHHSLIDKRVIEDLFIDSQKRIWVAIQGRLDFALITKNKKDIVLKDIRVNSKLFLKLSAKSVSELQELSNGNLILLANGKLFQLQSEKSNPQSIKILPLNSAFSNISKIKAHGNDLWLFYENKAIAVRIKNGQLFPFDEVGFQSSRIAGIEFSQNHLWISSNQGISRIDLTPSKDRVQLFLHSVVDPNSVCNDHQSGLFIDNKSNLWVSTYSAGVSYANIGKQKFELVKFMPIKSPKYLPNEFVYSIHEDSKGAIYVGTKFGGISKFNVQTKTFDYTINLKKKLGVNTVIPCIDSDDDWIYAAITFQGTSIYRIHKLDQRMELVKSYSPNTVFSFNFDKHQQLWVGVLGVGLSCLKIDKGKVVSEKLFTTQSDPILNLSSNQVNYVFNDKQKNEVLISTDNGLNRLMLNNKGDVTSIAYYISDEKNKTTLSSNYVWPIDKENDSTYWVGTMGTGLNRVIIGKRTEGTATYTAERFGVKEGAPSNDMESVLVDKFGNVWCGGRYLSRFDYKTKKFKTYYEEDGLQSYLFGTGTSCKARNGLLFFGGLKGMNYFMPDTATERQHYKVVFSRLIIDGKTLQVGDTLNGRVVLKNDLRYISQIKIPYPCNSLTIEFSSLTFAHKKSIQYRYKLEGFDKDWIYTNGNNPYALYPKLPYKKYQFIVEVGVDNQWSENGNAIEIDILPPWWQSILAYFIYTIIIILIGWYAAKYTFNWMNLKRQMSFQNEREKHKEELMELKMNFFTNISHEFKTPLTLINAAISEIETNDEHFFGNKYFQVVKRNNSKLLHLISELMDFQRSDASLIELKTTQIDVGKFLQEVFDEFIPLSDRSAISMKLTLPSTPVLAWIDEECMTKIISNIILNSLRYTEKGGSIDIQLLTGEFNSYKAKFKSQIAFTDQMQSGKQIIFVVADTGVGISSDSLPDIFERFHTIISKTSKHLGSGIGLALVKSLIELHRGGIRISSERNVGTEFVFSIPQESDYLSDNQKITDNQFDRHLYFDDYKVEIFDEELVQVEKNDGYKPTLLLVDDNQEILMILSEHFKADYNILLAEDGEEALKICNEKFPDLIISDVMMPKMTGLELCNRVKSQLNTCLIPIILLTARGTTEQQIEGIEEGADAYIPKPFHLGLLHSTIINLLNTAKIASQLHQSTDKNTGETKSVRNSAIDVENQQFIVKLTKLIELNLDNPTFSVDQLCIEIGVSRSRLYAQMKNIKNETLGDFIREMRLQKAVELMRTTSFTIGEVATQVGIDSPSFFTRTFKDRFGITPSEYLKKVINKEL